MSAVNLVGEWLKIDSDSEKEPVKVKKSYANTREKPVEEEDRLLEYWSQVGGKSAWSRGAAGLILDSRFLLR